MEFKEIDIDGTPKEITRCLVYCNNHYQSCYWKGFVDAIFDPHTGWSRCEHQDNKPLYVTHWTEYPDEPQ